MTPEMDLGKVQKEEAISRHTATLGNPDASVRMRFKSGDALRILSRDMMLNWQDRIKQ